MWIFYAFIGAISLAVVNSFFRLNPWGWSVFWILIASIPLTTFGTQYGFLKSYRLAPTFIEAWYLGSGATAIMGFLVSYFIFHEPIRVVTILGIGMILAGIWILSQ